MPKLYMIFEDRTKQETALHNTAETCNELFDGVVFVDKEEISFIEDDKMLVIGHSNRTPEEISDAVNKAFSDNIVTEAMDLADPHAARESQFFTIKEENVFIP